MMKGRSVFYPWNSQFSAPFAIPAAADPSELPTIPPMIPPMTVPAAIPIGPPKVPMKAPAWAPTHPPAHPPPAVAAPVVVARAMRSPVPICGLRAARSHWSFADSAPSRIVVTIPMRLRCSPALVANRRTVVASDFAFPLPATQFSGLVMSHIFSSGFMLLRFLSCPPIFWPTALVAPFGHRGAKRAFWA